MTTPKNINKHTKLLEAVENDDFDTVKKLLAKDANPNVQNEKGDTALMRAAFKGNTNIMELLLKKDIERNTYATRFQAQMARISAVDFMDSYNSKVPTITASSIPAQQNRENSQ